MGPRIAIPACGLEWHAGHGCTRGKVSRDQPYYLLLSSASKQAQRLSGPLTGCVGGWEEAHPSLETTRPTNLGKEFPAQAERAPARIAHGGDDIVSGAEGTKTENEAEAVGGARDEPDCHDGRVVVDDLSCGLRDSLSDCW